MPTDMFGVKIYQGNRVVVKPPAEMMSGIVSMIEDGKVSLPGKDGNHQQRPGHMVIMVDLHVYWDPNSPGQIGSVIVTMSQPTIGNAAFTTDPKKILAS